MAITLDQLIDIVQADLTMTGLFPKILPDLEIKRLVKENALEWFYKNYQYSQIKAFYFLDERFLTTEQYHRNKYLILPEEVENILRIVKFDNPSLFRLGIQAPHLSINLGVTNQPFLTSFVTTESAPVELCKTIFSTFLLYHLLSYLNFGVMLKYPILGEKSKLMLCLKPPRIFNCPSILFLLF